MTDAQKTTANQIIKEHKDLSYEKPIVVTMANGEIILKRNRPIVHPHYKEIDNDNILFGIGTEYNSYDMFVIGIKSWNIIKPKGAILDKAAYTDEELELTQEPVEISPFSSGGSLIRF
jgi:hypothetical protein